MRKLLGNLLLICVLITSASALAQNHPIKVRIEGISDTAVYLANYYGEKLFYNDTARADTNGYVEFKPKKGEEGGKYAVVVPGPKYFEILVTDEPIHIETSFDDLIGDLKVIESGENELFFNYMRFIQDKRNERAPFDQILADSTNRHSENEKAFARKEIERLNNEVTAHQQAVIDAHPGWLFSKMLKMTLEPEIPETPQGVDNEALWKYHYYRDHYWDNVDLTDGRLVRDPMFHRMLDKYWSKVLPQIPDTLIREAHALVEQAEAYDMFKYITYHITLAAEKSNLMCMDKVFVSMVNTYYRTGRVDWLSEEQLSKIIDRAEELKYVQCGEPVPNVILPDANNNWRALYDIDAKYTVIAIWEASCGHCKKEMPKLKELYQRWKPRGLEIYAIGNDFETEPWLKFIEERDLHDWINVSDNPEINATDSATTLIYSGITTLPSLNFRSTFDVFSTPKMFLLDADKKIVAKQLGAEQLEELLMRLEGDELPEKKNETPSSNDSPMKGKAVRTEKRTR